jgi:hypothetical protein
MSRIIPSHWGHQEDFRKEVQDLAQRVFGSLDPKLEPEVFLIGLVADHEDGIYPLFLDIPGEASSTSLFQKATARAKAIRAELYAERAAAKDRPEARREIVLEAWRRAVEQGLSESEKHQDVVSFCSQPRPVKEFLVCTVLRLSRPAWNAYYALRQDDADKKAGRPASLLDATVQVFMRRCGVGLAERHSGASASLVDSDPEEVVRAAGRLVSDAPALGGQQGLDLRGLWHACNTISSLHYEGASSRGQMLISTEDHPAITGRIRLRRPVPLTDQVAVRKLLETNQPGYSLLSDGTNVYGLGSLNLESSVPDQSLFNVRFLQHYTWELAYGLRTLMLVSYGHPQLPSSRIGEDVFRSLARRTFPGLEPGALEGLWNLATAASRQPHGTLLVISSNAKEEAERLGRQAAPIEPRTLDETGILALTSVDGALLADPQGVVHAFSVILDGLASARGNPARGARFNATLRYVDSCTTPCMAIVVSEDGAVNLVSTVDDPPVEA